MFFNQNRGQGSNFDPEISIPSTPTLECISVNNTHYLKVGARNWLVPLAKRNKFFLVIVQSIALAAETQGGSYNTWGSCNTFTVQ